jgi:hypothetical protein
MPWPASARAQRNWLLNSSQYQKENISRPRNVAIECISVTFFGKAPIDTASIIKIWPSISFIKRLFNSTLKHRVVQSNNTLHINNPVKD